MKCNNPIIFILENFTNSGRTPPRLDTYLQMLPNFGTSGKTFPIRMKRKARTAAEEAEEEGRDTIRLIRPLAGAADELI